MDRDTQIGTGSTDILLGGFYRGNITEDEKWDWFAQGLLDVPVLIQAGYRPGVELDTAAGIDYKGFSLGRVQISPVAQVIFSERTSDSGSTPILTIPVTSVSCFRRESNFTFIR